MDKNIYRCPVTGAYYDPLGVQRKLLLGSKGQVNSWLADQRGGDELASLAAEEKLLPLIRSSFALPDLDSRTGEGSGTAVCLKVLECYLLWADEKKEMGQPSPNVLPCSDCP